MIHYNLSRKMSDLLDYRKFNFQKELSDVVSVFHRNNISSADMSYFVDKGFYCFYDLLCINDITEEKVRRYIEAKEIYFGNWEMLIEFEFRLNSRIRDKISILSTIKLCLPEHFEMKEL